MHVLLAVTAGTEDRVHRALDWARASGAKYVERVDTDRATIALASRGAAEAYVRRQGNTTVMSLGLQKVNNFAELLAGRIANGTIAIAINPEQELIASGDGNQRLFVIRDARGAIVSSHVGALIAALGPDAVIDRTYEDFLLGFGFIPDGRTSIEGIRAMSRPSISTLRTGRTVMIAPSVPTEETETDLARLVCEIVDEQAGATKRVGVLLGGFDSALVAAALSRTGREVHTFTFKFPERGFGQRNVDAAVAAAKARHHWVPITPHIMASALVELPARLNQPSPQPHYQLQTILAAEAARDAGAEAIFTGDGCDALFAAYPTINTRAAANNTLQRIPASLRRTALQLLSTKPSDAVLGHVARVGRSALRTSLVPRPASQHLPTQYLDRVALDRLRRDVTPTQAESILQIRKRLAEASGLSGSARLAVDGNALTGQTQSKVEGVVARTGLQVFSPFTHVRFRMAVRALPQDRQLPAGKLRGAEGKPALQEAAAASGLLPEAVIYQKKQSPTASPIDAWYAGPLRSTVFELLDGLPFAYHRPFVEEILSRKFAENVYREHLTISHHALQAIGLLISYAASVRHVTRW